MNDAQLIADTLAGDREAFGQLVQRYQNRLFNTLLHVLGSREEAEDVMQEAFVQAFLKLSSFQGRSAFYTWLYRIAFNHSVSRRRRQRPRSSIDQHHEQTGSEIAGHEDTPDRHLLRQEQIQQVHHAIGQLSEEHRAILVLRDIEGFDYKAIGEILDLTPGTVRSRLHRARLQLRDELKEILGSDLEK